MFRILGRIAIYGTREGLDRLQIAAPIVDGKLQQIGLRRKEPSVNSWLFSSPWVSFHASTLDEELRGFLSENIRVSDFLSEQENRIRLALLSISPVGQSHEHMFSCVLSRKTLDVLHESRLALEISPAVEMPAAVFWEPKK